MGTAKPAFGFQVLDAAELCRHSRRHLYADRHQHEPGRARHVAQSQARVRRSGNVRNLLGRRAGGAVGWSVHHSQRPLAIARSKTGHQHGDRSARIHRRNAGGARQPAGRPFDRGGRLASLAGSVSGRNRPGRQRAAGRLAAGSVARQRPAVVCGHHRIGRRLATHSRPVAGHGPGHQTHGAAHAAAPDRGGSVEQLPAGGQNDPRRALSQRVQRGRGRRGSQRRTVAQEDRRRRAPRRRHAVGRGTSFVRRSTPRFARLLLGEPFARLESAAARPGPDRRGHIDRDGAGGERRVALDPPGVDVGGRADDFHALHLDRDRPT